MLILVSKIVWLLRITMTDCRSNIWRLLWIFQFDCLKIYTGPLSSVFHMLQGTADFRMTAVRSPVMERPLRNAGPTVPKLYITLFPWHSSCDWAYFQSASQSFYRGGGGGFYSDGATDSSYNMPGLLIAVIAINFTSSSSSPLIIIAIKIIIKDNNNNNNNGRHGAFICVLVRFLTFSRRKRFPAGRFGRAALLLLVSLLEFTSCLLFELYASNQIAICSFESLNWDVVSVVAC